MKIVAVLLLLLGLAPASAQTKHVLIEKMPSGDAPEWVRKAWVGLRLPVVRHAECTEFGLTTGKKVEPSYGAVVWQDHAIEALRKSSPEAAQWWIDKGYPDFRLFFCFRFEPQAQSPFRGLFFFCETVHQMFLKLLYRRCRQEGIVMWLLVFALIALAFGFCFLFIILFSYSAAVASKSWSEFTVAVGLGLALNILWLFVLRKFHVPTLAACFDWIVMMALVMCAALVVGFQIRSLTRKGFFAPLPYRKRSFLLPRRR